MSIFRKFNLLLSFSLLISFSFAQPIADFQVGLNEDSVCVNDNVHFTNNSDTSSCSGNIQYAWDFDDGTTSTNVNPVMFFNSAGVYDVMLTVTCNGFSDSHQKQIVVMATPNVDFQNVNYQGCVPYTHNFVNNSSPNGGGSLDYYWTFGDGTDDTTENPTHTYSSPGQFSVYLEGTNANGCSDTSLIVNAIMLSDTPNVSIDANPISWCQTPVDINFTSQINVFNSLGYTTDWTFGDGGVSTAENPTYSYNNNGDYDVSLTVTDDYGCSKQIDSIDFIHIHPVSPDYTLLNSNHDEITDDIVCYNQETYFICENEGYSVEWDFGDGSTSQSPLATNTYTGNGNYTVTMTVDPGGTCEASTSFTVQVENPDPSFTTNPDPAFSCSVPFSVEFIPNTSVNVVQYDWLFGDGDMSTNQNPTHNYTGQGTFSPVLTVTSDHGCQATYYGPSVEISSPSSSFHSDTSQGCIPLDVTFNYDGITDPSAITSFDWDFDDGTTINNGDSIENHTYTVEGEYEISLTITDTSGCTSTSTVTINAGDQPTALFDSTLYPSQICPQDTIDFESLSTPASEIDNWEWLYGEHDIWQWGQQGDSIVENYTFEKDTGWVSITHVVTQNGCTDTLVVDSLFHVNPPIIDGTNYEHDCSTPDIYTIKPTLIGADDWDCYVEDSNNNQIDQYLNITADSLNITLTNQGSYWVYLTAYNSTSGCEYVDSLEVIVSQAVADLSINPSSGCAGDDFQLDASGSQNTEQYFWDFGDGNTSGWCTSVDTLYSWDTVGDINVWLKARDINGCEDSVMQTIHIEGPMITVTSSPVSGCVPQDIQISGYTDADAPISYLEMNLGGITDTIIYSNTNNYETFNFNINNITQQGSFNLSVYVITDSGCEFTEIIQDYLILTSIDADFTAESIDDGDREVCIEDSLEFSPVSPDPSFTYNWDFGDGNTSTQMNPVHYYSNPGIYSVELEINGNGCNKTETKTDYISVQEANADFSLNTSSLGCPPQTLNSSIISLPPEDSTSIYTWSDNLNHTSTGYNNYNFTYYEAGEFWLTLTEETSYGCISQDSELVVLDGPKGDIYINGTEFFHNGTTDPVCVNDTIIYEIRNGEDIDFVEWTFGNGSSDIGDSVVSSYNSTPDMGNTFKAKAMLNGIGGCNYNLIVNIPVYDVMADFSILDQNGDIADTVACSPYVIDLQNESSGNDLSYMWTVDGYGTNNMENWTGIDLVNDTQHDSIVNITLQIEQDSVGCTDFKSDEITIGYIPDPVISNDTVICEGDSIRLSADNGAQYIWYPGLYLSNTDTSSTLATPEEDMTYYLTVTSSNNCSASDSVNIELLLPADVSLQSSSDTIMIGDNITNSVITDQEYVNYLWSPDEAISCIDCPSPVFNPLEDQIYELRVNDTLGCFTQNFVYSVFVDQIYSLDIPDAFTPESNDDNSVIKVNGLGIKKLVEFSVYNRWGEKIFTTNDINQGWDGYYKGKLQAVDNYAYYIEAEMWSGKTKTKKGTFMLLK